MTQDLDEAELRRKLISGAKWATVLRVTAQAFSWLVGIVVVRFLSPADYGLNAMLEVPVELLMLFSVVGMDMALVQKRSRSDEELSAVFGLLLLVNGVFFLALVFGAGEIAAYFREPRLTLLIQVTAVIFLLSPFRVIPDALLDRELAFKVKAQAEMGAAVASSLLSLVLAIVGAGVWALIAALVVNFVLRAAFLAYLKPWFVRPNLKFRLVKGLLRYGGVLAGSATLVVLSGKALSLIAGPVVGPQALGYYAVAYTFAMLALSKLMPIIQQTMYPAFAQLADNPDRARHYLEKSLEITSIVTIPISVGLACVASDFVVTIFGAHWLPAAVPLMLLSLSTPMRMVTNLVTPALNALGHAGAVFWINFTMMSLVAGSSYFAASFGVTGLVVTWIGAVAISMVITVAVARFCIGVTVAGILRAVGPAAMASLIMVAILLLANSLVLEGAGIVRLVAEIRVGAVIYVTAMWLLFRERFDAVRNHLLKS